MKLNVNSDLLRDLAKRYHDSLTSLANKGADEEVVLISAGFSPLEMAIFCQHLAALAPDKALARLTVFCGHLTGVLQKL